MLIKKHCSNELPHESLIVFTNPAQKLRTIYTYMSKAVIYMVIMFYCRVVFGKAWNNSIGKFGEALI